MKYTKNYNLNKPENDDFYNVEDFNQNMDSLDSKVKEIEDLGNTHSENMENHVAVRGSSTVSGHVKLSDSISSTSNANGGAAATPLAVKTVNDKVVNHTGNTENPHNVTAEQLGLGNIPNVSTNDQTPTYTENGTLSALSSGEKLSVAFGKIAKAVSTLISHISTKATASGLGHVKLSDSSAVTDSTGLALPATEKNANISGTLANLIYSVNTALNAAINSLITRVTSLETVSSGIIAPYTTDIVVSSYNIKRQGKIVTFEALITYNGSDSLNNKNVLYISENIKPTSAVHLLGANGTNGLTHRFIIDAGSTVVRSVSISANSSPNYKAGQEVCIIGSWSVE